MSGNCRELKSLHFKAVRTQEAIKMNIFYAGKYHNKFPFVEQDELISAGLVGIAVALKSWDKKRKKDKIGYCRTGPREKCGLSL